MSPAGAGRGAVGASVARWMARALGVAVATFAPISSAAHDGDATAVDVMRLRSQVSLPPALSEPELTLAEAIRLTLLYDPRLGLERQDIDVALGVLQEARGAFDPLLGGTGSFTYSEQQLFPVMRKREEDKRTLFGNLARGAQRLLDLLNPRLEALNEQGLDALDDFNNLGVPPCPEGFDSIVVDLRGLRTPFVVGRDLTRRSGVDFGDAFLRFAAVRGLDRDIGSLLAICEPRVRRRNPTAGILKRLNDILGQQLEVGAELENSFNAIRDILTVNREVAELIARKSELALERQGAPPKDEVTKTVSIELGYSKPFRTGVAVGFDLRLQATERNFEDKSLDPAFGGMGIPTGFPNSVSVSLDLPLGEGFGRVSAGAPERAAEVTVRARQERLRHTITEEVFGTVLAYLDLVAAQETLRYLEESGARQMRLAGITEELVEAGDIVRAELDRALARAAAVSRAVADARLSVLKARLVLADAIGLKVEELGNAPLAGQGFRAALEETPEIPSLVQQAVARRRDLRAISHSRTALRILADAARADLKPRIDINFTGGLSTLYESPFFKVFPDELDEPTESPVRFYSPRGMFRSFDGDWEPFIQVGLTFELPFGNNVDKGRLLQRRSSLRSSEIRLADLERVIRDNIVSVAGALERARRVVERRRESVRFAEQTLAAAMARYEAGDISLVDTIVTEEDLTREQIELVRATQTYLSLLARLRFEVGELVNFKDEGTPLERVEFTPAEFVAERQG